MLSMAPVCIRQLITSSYTTSGWTVISNQVPIFLYIDLPNQHNAAVDCLLRRSTLGILQCD
ncbi:hypothetical protein MBANPS3_005205 [Mucor bainieri]